MDEFIAGQLDGKTDMVTMVMMAGAALDLQNKVIIIISNNLKLTAFGTLRMYRWRISCIDVYFVFSYRAHSTYPESVLYIYICVWR